MAHCVGQQGSEVVGTGSNPSLYIHYSALLIQPKISIPSSDWKFLKHRWVPLRIISVLWDKKIDAKSCYPSPSSYAWDFLTPEFFGNTKGFPHNFFPHCEAKKVNGNSWYSFAKKNIDISNGTDVCRKSSKTRFRIFKKKSFLPEIVEPSIFSKFIRFFQHQKVFFTNCSFSLGITWGKIPSAAQTLPQRMFSFVRFFTFGVKRHFSSTITQFFSRSSLFWNFERLCSKPKRKNLCACVFPSSNFS